MQQLRVSKTQVKEKKITNLFFKGKKIKIPQKSFPAPPCEELQDLKPPDFPGKSSPAAPFVPAIPDDI